MRKAGPFARRDADPKVNGTLVYPDITGGANLWSPTYSPKTQLFYQAAREIAGIYYKGDAEYKEGTAYTGGGGEAQNRRRSVRRDARARSNHGEIALGIQALHAAAGRAVVYGRRSGVRRRGRRQFLRAGCRNRASCFGSCNSAAAIRANPTFVCDRRQTASGDPGGQRRCSYSVYRSRRYVVPRYVSGAYPIVRASSQEYSENSWKKACQNSWFRLSRCLS